MLSIWHLHNSVETFLPLAIIAVFPQNVRAFLLLTAYLNQEFINYFIEILMSIKTEKIFKESDLDKGFILRANDIVTRTLRDMIQKNSQEENAQKNLEIISLDPSKRCFG